MKTRVVVTTLIEKDDQILFGRKRVNVGPYPNTWHLIGGGVEDGEPVIEAVKREIKEEAGIEVDHITPLGFDEDFEPNKDGEITHYIFLIFQAHYVSGKLRPDDDIEHLEWIPKSKLATLELNRPTIKYFKKVGYLAS